MQDKSINKIDEPGFLQNQQANVPLISQLHISSQVSQPYIVQLIPQSNETHSSSQPYIVQLPNQPYSIHQLAQPDINTQVSQPEATNSFFKFFGIQTKQPVTASGYLKIKLCFPICWSWFLLIPLFSCVFFFSLKHLVPVEEIFGLIVVFIVAFLVYQSAETNDPKKYNIALYLFIIYFIFATIAYIYNLTIVIKSDFIRDIAVYFYLGEFLSELIALYILCNHKKVFDKEKYIENKKILITQTYIPQF